MLVNIFSNFCSLYHKLLMTTNNYNIVCNIFLYLPSFVHYNNCKLCPIWLYLLLFNPYSLWPQFCIVFAAYFLILAFILTPMVCVESSIQVGVQSRQLMWLSMGRLFSLVVISPYFPHQQIGSGHFLYNQDCSALL